MRLPRALVLLGAAGLLVPVAACSSESSTPATTAPPATSAPVKVDATTDALVDAAEKSYGEDVSTYTMLQVVDTENSEVDAGEATIEATVAVGEDAALIEVDASGFFEGFPDLADELPGPQVYITEPFTVRNDDGDVIISSGALAEWADVDAEWLDLGSDISEGDDFSTAFWSSEATVPVLLAAASDVEEAGQEDVDGTATAKLTFTIDPGDVEGDGEDGFIDSDLDNEVTGTAWIDGEGYLRKLEMSAEGSQDGDAPVDFGDGTITYTLTWTPGEGPELPEVDADEVEDITDQLDAFAGEELVEPTPDAPPPDSLPTDTLPADPTVPQ